MARYKVLLVVLVLLVVVYEFLGLAGYWPPITTTVASLPLFWVLAIAAGLVVLAVHFIRAWQRRQSRR